MQESHAMEESAQTNDGHVYECKDGTVHVPVSISNQFVTVKHLREAIDDGSDTIPLPNLFVADVERVVACTELLRDKADEDWKKVPVSDAMKAAMGGDDLRAVASTTNTANFLDIQPLLEECIKRIAHETKAYSSIWTSNMAPVTPEEERQICEKYPFLKA